MMKATLECPEGGVVTLECDCNAPRDSPEEGKKTRHKERRHVSDQQIIEWVNRWRTHHTPFQYMAGEGNFSERTVALNIYKHCTFEAEGEIKKLKKELANSRLLAQALQEQVERLQSLL